jgi:hypothetical protein
MTGRVGDFFRSVGETAVDRFGEHELQPWIRDLGIKDRKRKVEG